MSNTFSQCFLADLVDDILLSFRQKPQSALDEHTIQHVADIFRDRPRCDAVLCRHPKVLRHGELLCT